MSPLAAAFLYIVGPLLAAAGVVIAARFASKGSVKAAEVTANTEEKTSAVTGYHQLVLDLQTDMARLRLDHNDLAARHDELNKHVVRLEAQATKDKSLIRWLIFYIKTLRDEIVRLGGKVPEAPAGLDLYLDTGAVPDTMDA